MNPPGFQMGRSGCATPAVYQQRVRSALRPRRIGTVASQRRKLYLPSSGPSVVRYQVRPPPDDTSTLATPQSPPIAMPPTGIAGSAAISCPSARLVTQLRGIIRLIGTVGKSLAPGCTSAPGVAGTLYALAIQYWSSAAGSTSIEFSILTQ